MPRRPAPFDAPPHTPRRGFLAQLATAAAAFTAGSIVHPSRAVARDLTNGNAGALARSDTTPAPRGPWDLSWVDKLTAQHRQVFDSPQIADGQALNKAGLYIDGYHEVYGISDKEINVVIVVRHMAIPMVLGNDVWAHYDFLADRTKLKDPTTGKQAKRNPFVGVKADDKYALTEPNSSLDSLIARGAIVLCCNLALGAVAGLLAEKTKQSNDTVRAELKRSLVPGVTLVPSGIFGVTRAEEAGCHYLGLSA
jgi:intracellular sulfur oxidation DsrE/DsrF family protein